MAVPLPRPLRVSTRATSILRAVVRVVSEAGSWAQVGRVCCRVLRLLGEHGERLCGDVENFCRELADDDDRPDPPIPFSRPE